MGDRRKHARVLTTRRARLIPEQVGLPPTRSRRVPCLRRSEVASVAGLSVEYYARLERGQIAGASSGVVEALARALQVDETESAHLSPSPDNAELGALAEYLHPTRVFAPPQALHPRSSGGQSNDSQTDDLTSATCP